MKTENLCECGHIESYHNENGCQNDIVTLDSKLVRDSNGKVRKCPCKRFNPKKIGILELAKRIKDEDRELVKPKNQNHSQDAEGILSSAGSAKTSDFQKHRLLTLDAREPAKISGIQGPQNNKPTAETDKAADTQTLFDKVREMKQGDIVYHTLAYFEKEDVRSAVQKLKEIPMIYWECNECRTMWIYGNEPKICSCGNDIFANSTKRKIINFGKIDAIFGRELSNG